MSVTPFIFFEISCSYIFNIFSERYHNTTYLGSKMLYIEIKKNEEILININVVIKLLGYSAIQPVVKKQNAVFTRFHEIGTIKWKVSCLK